MKTDLFQYCGHCWVFQICWHIECSTFIALSFTIWNSSAEIPSPLLALFVVMLPKAHLTSHSRMYDSRWVITPSWLSGSWRSFLYSPSVYSYHLFLTDKFGLGLQNEAGQRLIEFCQENALVIANTLFHQHKTRLYTWTSPDGQYQNQMEKLYTVSKNKTRSWLWLRHELLIAKFRLKLKKWGNR